jgi:hypothetical protein
MANWQLCPPICGIFLEMLPTAVLPVSCSIRTNCLVFFLLAVSSFFFCEFVLRFFFADIVEGSCVNAHDGGWALATSFVWLEMAFVTGPTPVGGALVE